MITAERLIHTDAPVTGTAADWTKYEPIVLEVGQHGETPYVEVRVKGDRPPICDLRLDPSEARKLASELNALADGFA